MPTLPEPVLQVFEYLKLANQVLKLNIDGYAFAIEGEIFVFLVKSNPGLFPAALLRFLFSVS